MYRLVAHVGKIDGKDVYVRDNFTAVAFATRDKAQEALDDLEAKAPRLASGLHVAEIVGSRSEYRRFAEVWQVSREAQLSNGAARGCEWL